MSDLHQPLNKKAFGAPLWIRWGWVNRLFLLSRSQLGIFYRGFVTSLGWWRTGGVTGNYSLFFISRFDRVISNFKYPLSAVVLEAQWTKFAEWQTSSHRMLKVGKNKLFYKRWPHWALARFSRYESGCCWFDKNIVAYSSQPNWSRKINSMLAWRSNAFWIN